MARKNLGEVKAAARMSGRVDADVKKPAAPGVRHAEQQDYLLASEDEAVTNAADAAVARTRDNELAARKRGEHELADRIAASVARVARDAALRAQRRWREEHGADIDRERGKPKSRVADHREDER